jgi:hypothetical protein
LASFVLAGCASQSFNAQPQSNAEVAAADDAKCQAHGYQPGTPPYEKCRSQLTDQRVQAETDDRAALAGRLLGRPPM